MQVTPTITILMVCTLLVLPGMATAQEVTRRDASMPPPQVATRSARGIADEPSGPVGIGADYKVHFTAGAVAFTPALGEAAPHNLSLRWTMLDARRGESVVHSADPTVSPRHADDAVLFERGKLTERYDVLAEGLKQSFVFAEPLPGNGDLVVRGRIQCELPAEAGTDGSWSWSMPGVGGVRVSAVVGIDADGRRVGGSMQVVEGVLELALPAAFVDSARYPLTLDPLLGTQVLYSGAHDAIECDVAGSVPNFLYFMVWSRRYSSGDADVYGTYVDATGGMIANLVAFDVSTAQARRPQVAFGSQGYRYFVAWELSTSLLASRDVRAAATTLSGSPSVAGKSADIVVAATADDETEVDVSAEWDLVTPSVLVVHRKSTGIFGQRFDVPVNGIPTPSSGVVMLVPGANVGDAAVSQLGNGSVAMLVAYRFPGTFSDDIGVLLLDGSLNPIGATLTLGSNLLDESQPAIDGTMVTWSREESPLAGAKRDIICATFGMQSGALVVVTPPTVVAGASGVDEHGPTIARVGFRHCVAYVRNVGFLDDDIEAWLVNDDCTTCNSRIVLQGVGSGSYVREGAPSMASDWRHGFDGDRLLLAFTEADVAPPFSSQVVGQMIRGLAVGPSPVNLGGGCGFGGTASTDGASSVGNSLFELVLSGATPVGLHVLSLGMPGPGITCGACTLTDPLVLTIVGGAGSATSAFPIPCAASVAGAQFEAQWLTMFAAVDPCLLLPGVSSSNRLLVTIAN